MRSSGEGLRQGRDEISQRVESVMNDASRRSHSRGSVWADECREMDGVKKKKKRNIKNLVGPHNKA